MGQTELRLDGVSEVRMALVHYRKGVLRCSEAIRGRGGGPNPRRAGGPPPGQRPWP
jgi:hypothetical protein